jgi:hypothetical protein
MSTSIPTQVLWTNTLHFWLGNLAEDKIVRIAESVRNGTNLTEVVIEFLEKGPLIVEGGEFGHFPKGLFDVHELDVLFARLQRSVQNRLDFLPHFVGPFTRRSPESLKVPTQLPKQGKED